MEEVISSMQNNRVKYLRKLYNSKNRRQEQKYILEGSRLVEQAIKANVRFDQVFMTVDFADSEEGKNIKKFLHNDITYLEPELVNEIADTVSPQGIIAVVEEPVYDNDNFLDNRNMILVLDRVQDPGNMGTLIRTAVAAGVGGIIALKGCVDIYNLKVIRSTVGAIFNIPVKTRVSWKEFINLVNQHKDYSLISTDLSAEKYHHQLDYNYPLMLVIGNEANGIRKEILEISNYKVKIPIIGQIESLNAAVAGGIIMYEAAINNL